MRDRADPGTLNALESPYNATDRARVKRHDFMPPGPLSETVWRARLTQGKDVAEGVSAVLPARIDRCLFVTTDPRADRAGPTGPGSRSHSI